MNMFEKLTQQNRITSPFGHKVKLNNTTFNMTDVEEIKFIISFERVFVEINDDQIASLISMKTHYRNLVLKVLLCQLLKN